VSFLPDFKENLNTSRNWSKNHKYEIPQNFLRWKACRSLRTAERTGITRLISRLASDLQWQVIEHYLSILSKMSTVLCPFFNVVVIVIVLLTIATPLPVDANFVFMQLYFQHLQ